jgi:hypothetical protein
LLRLFHARAALFHHGIDALAGATERFLALKDFGHRVCGAAGHAVCRRPAVSNQALDSGFQPLDRAIELVQRSAGAIVWGIRSRSVHVSSPPGMPVPCPAFTCGAALPQTGIFLA